MKTINFYNKIISLSLVFSLVFLFTISSASITNAQSCYSFMYPMSIGSTDASTNGEVGRLQNILFNLGLLKVTPTGYYGEITYIAVINFQTTHGLSPVGNVGPLTRAALSQGCGVSTSIGASIGTSIGAIIPANNTDQFAQINEDLGCIEIPYDLSIGSRDMALYGNVLKIQTYLFQNGVLNYPPTGYYGNLTQAAVARYQNLRSLPQTGVLDFPARITLAKETCHGVSTLIPPSQYTQSINSNYASPAPQGTPAPLLQTLPSNQ